MKPIQKGSEPEAFSDWKALENKDWEPTYSTCEERFRFTGDGEIKPARDGDKAASTTITKLGLDIPKLNSLRASAIEPFLSEDLSPADLSAFVSGYLKKDSTGRFGEFWTTIRYLFGKPTTK